MARTVRPRIRSPFPRVRMRAMRRTWRHFGPLVLRWWPTLTGAVLAAIATTGLTLLLPFPLKLLFDYVVVPDGEGGAAWLREAAASAPLKVTGWLCLAMIGVAAGRAVVESWQILLTAFTGQRVVAAIRVRLYSHLQTLSASFHDQSRTGDLIVRLTGDINMMRELLVASTVEGMNQWLTLIGMAVVMACYDLPLTLVALAVIPVLAVLAFRYSFRITAATRKQRKTESDLATSAQEALVGMREIQAFTRERFERKRFERHAKGNLKAGLRATRLQIRLNRLVQVVVGAGMAAVFFLGVQRVLEGTMSAGTLLLFAAYVRGMYRPIRRLAFFANRAAKGTACAQRILEVLNEKPTITDAPDAEELKEVEGRVAFEGVSFSYQPDSPALREVSFRVEPGEVVALVGPSGGGKSTLVNLLLRFYDPTSGRVTVDGTDIRGVTLSSLRRQISIVPQNPVLFGLSVADNVAFGKPKVSREKVRKAAERADALEFIERLPDGFETVLGERGESLSGGERQRIAIARAFLKRAAVLVLDEPAAGLDSVSEKQVRRALHRLAEGRTAFLIDHRFSMVAGADRILYLEGGRIVEEGTHEELMARGGAYRRLYQAQVGKVRAGS